MVDGIRATSNPYALGTGLPLQPVLRRQASEPSALSQFQDKFWSGVNKLATKPVQYYFSHGSNNVKLSAEDKNLQAFGANEAREILAHARPGDIILWGTKDSFVHGSIYIGNGEIVHALAARAPQGQKNGVIRERLADYVARVDRERVQILRPRHNSPAGAAARIDYAVKQVGKDYDYLFRTGKTDAYYCTELTWLAAVAGPRPPAIEPHGALMGAKKLITTDDIRRSPDLQEVWGKNVPPIGDKPALGLS